MTTLSVRIGGARRVIGGPFGSNLTQADYALEGVPVIRGSNMERDGRWVGGEFTFVSVEKAASDLRSNIARPGDIIVTQRGTMGQVSIVPEETFYEQFVISQSQMAISVDPDCASRDFVYYYLRSSHYATYLGNSIIQTGVPHINLGILRQAPVDWPELNVQQAIASILGALDDKIDLNRRMNETLEAMARAIFQDWFVTFGPTRAKQEDRPPYLAPDLWALFPNRLDDDGKPERWRAGSLLDLCQLKRGYDLPALQRVPGPVPIVSSSGITDHHERAMVDGPGVVTGRYGTIGEVFFIEEPFWPLNTALYIKDFRGNSRRFVFYLLRLLDFGQYSDKGAVPGVNRNDLHRAPATLPPPKVQQAFEAILAPAWECIAANVSESRTLAATRDLLLPKLMSGELRVRDAERVAEAAL